MASYQPFASNRPKSNTKIPHPAPLKPRTYKNLNLLAPTHRKTKANHNKYIRNEIAALNAYHENEYAHKKHLLNQLESRHVYSIPEENNENALSNEAGNQFMNRMKQHYSTLKARELNKLRNKQANRSRRMEKTISGMLYHHRTHPNHSSPLPPIAPRYSYHNARKSPLSVSQIKRLRKIPSMRKALATSLPLMENDTLSSYVPPHVSQAVRHNHNTTHKQMKTRRRLLYKGRV
jgi:hypothetical protein